MYTRSPPHHPLITMGRPLFSHQYTTTVPAVRVEPEHIQVTQPYVRWDYLHPFDPDSEEFFANAELETPVDILPGDGDGDRELSSPLIDTESGSSSDSSSSGSASPTREVMMQADILTPDVIAGMRLGRAGRDDEESAYTYRANAERAPRTRPALAPPAMPAARQPSFYFIDAPVRAIRAPSPDSLDTEPTAALYMPALALPVPPSTPPPSMSAQLLDPSPPPSVTPRLYSWSRLRADPAAPPASPSPAPIVPRLHPGFTPAPPHLWPSRHTDYTHTAHGSPSASSPLPNLGARMSVAHITPSITSGRIRV